MIDQLIDCGVGHIYGMPGNSINQFVDDLRRREEDIDFIQVRHEEAGALAASAYAKLTGKLGVCMSIGGPGAAHLINGLYDAKKDFAPVLAIVGQVPSTEVGTDAHQEINLETLFEGVSVFNRRVETAKQLPDMLNAAIREAYIHKGVSVLIAPDDLFAAKQNINLKKISGPFFQSSVIPKQETLENSKELIQKAEKPIILAGKGAFHARDELIEFAKKIKAPIVLSLLGKGTIPDNHELNLGQHGQIGTKPAYEAMMEADLLILIGTSFPYSDYLPENTKAIQIDIKENHLGKIYPITEGLLGDAKEIISILTSTLNESTSDSFLRKYQEKMKKWNNHMKEQKEDETDPLYGPQVMNAVEKVVEDDAIISCDVGNVTVWTTRFLSFTNQKFVMSGGLATMGSGLPGAIAANIAYPDKQVVAITGDGGFSMVMHDFVTAVKYEMPIKIVILNNSKIGMIKYEQQTEGKQNYVTDLGEINFAAFAKACGGEGFRIEDFSELNGVMKEAFQTNKPTIIDIVTEDIAPLPGKIKFEQAVSYSKYLLKEFFNNGSVEFPDIKKTINRLL